MNYKIDDGKIIYFISLKLRKTLNIELINNLIFMKRIKVVQNNIKKISLTSFSNYYNESKFFNKISSSKTLHEKIIK